MTIELPIPANRDSLSAEVGEAIGARFGSEFVMSAPYPVELIDLAAMLDTRQMRLATDGGVARWQCIVGPAEVGEPVPDAEDGSPRDELAAVDVAERLGDTYSVISIDHGARAAAVNRAIRVAAENAEGASYWFSTVELPELHFAAVRMAGPDESQDVYIPLVDAELPPDVDGVGEILNQPMRPQELTDVLLQWWDWRGPGLSNGEGPDRDRG